MIKIKHIAHACFLIENSSEKLLIDPYDHNVIGYDPIDEAVNYLLISHNHYDHNFTENIKVEDNIGSFKITKIDSYHDNENGNLRGNNTIHIIDTENTRICHLGDLGHKLTDEQIRLIGNVNVLLIPVGGKYTIDYKGAIEVVNQLNPSRVVPMHYQANGWGEGAGLASADNFINNIQGYEIVKIESNELNYSNTLDKSVYVI